MEKDMMTEAELAQAVDALRAEVGPHAYVSLDIATTRPRSEGPVQCFLRPHGFTRRDVFICYGATWQAAMDAARNAWLAKKADLRADLLNRMALAIIEITARQGACSDAALRAQDFAQADIDAIGTEACEEAERMAASGPFRIVPVAGANAA